MRRGQRPLLTGLLIIPAALLPALLRIEALGRFVLSERYLYISMFGFALFAVAAVAQFTSKFSIQRVGLLLMLIVAVAGLAAWPVQAQAPESHVSFNDTT